MAGQQARLRRGNTRRTVADARGYDEDEYENVNVGAHIGEEGGRTMYYADMAGKYCCMLAILGLAIATLVLVVVMKSDISDIEREQGLTVDTDCSDGNVCTVDALSTGSGGCVHHSEKNGEACVDGCHTATSSPTCNDGVCQGGTCSGTCAVVADCPVAGTHFNRAANTTCFNTRCIYTFGGINFPALKINGHVVVVSSGLLLSTCQDNVITTSPFVDCFNHDVITNTNATAGIDIECTTYFACTVD